MTDRAKQIIKTTIGEEGGLSNDPDDKGGRTLCGIASAYFPKEFDEIISVFNRNGYLAAQQYAFNFYYIRFWDDQYDEIEDSSLLQQLFDFGVNAGQRTAVSLLQNTINKMFNYGLTVDGEFGKHTLEAVNLFSKESKAGECESALHNEYELTIAKWYKGRNNFWKFGKGWLKRLRKVFNL